MQRLTSEPVAQARKGLAKQANDNKAQAKHGHQRHRLDREQLLACQRVTSGSLRGRRGMSTTPRHAAQPRAPSFSSQNFASGPHSRPSLRYNSQWWWYSIIRPSTGLILKHRPGSDPARVDAQLHGTLPWLMVSHLCSGSTKHSRRSTRSAQLQSHYRVRTKVVRSSGDAG